MTALLDHIAPALLVIFRIGGLTIYGPLFGSPVIPARFKIMITFVVGIAVYPVVGEVAAPVVPLRLDLWALAPLAAFELAIGLVIGFLASLPMIAVQTGGLMMGQQMGLGFANFYNPAMDTEADVIGQILFFMVLAGFIAVGGHEAMLLAILHSFSHVPLGTMAVDAHLLDLVVGLLSGAFELALRVAAPLLALVYLESVAMGFVAKTVPQLNILSLGFPIRILAGLLIIFLGLEIIDEVVMESADEVLAVIFTWVGA